MENEKWRMENGKLRMVNGELKMENGEFILVDDNCCSPTESYGKRLSILMKRFAVKRIIDP